LRQGDELAVHDVAAESLSCREMHGGTRSRPRARRKVGRQVADRWSVSADLINLVWRHKLWWMLPLLVAMAVLVILIVLEPTAIGPLLYPLF
jgi:hypothetical protein